MLKIERLPEDIGLEVCSTVSANTFQDMEYLRQVSDKVLILSASFFDLFHTMSKKLIDYINTHFSTLYVQSSTPNALIYKLSLLIQGGKKNAFEEEWARYKYKVLEFSVQQYQAMRQYLKEHVFVDQKEFYQIIETAFLMKREHYFENAALHVFGYFKKELTTVEKRNFLEKLKGANTDQKKDAIRNILYKFVMKFNKTYLKDSYFFISNIG